MKFVFRTDVHCADKGPDSWKGDYPNEIFSNLEQIGQIAREQGAIAVLDGGDFFHHKAPGRSSHGLVTKVSQVHAAYPCPTFSIEGNHDMVYNSLESIERQPLGVLYSTRVFRRLRDEVFEEDGVRVRVVGVPYVPDRGVEFFRSLQKQPGDTHLIAIVHALAGKDPPDHVADFFGEPVFRYGDLIHDNGPDLYCFGHWHRDQGIETIRDHWFVNCGAVSRGALVRENLERVPRVAVIDATASGISATAVPLRVAPASEVFYLERKERRDKEEAVIEQFVERLGDMQFDATVPIETSIERLNFARNVRDLALEYLRR